MDLRSGRSQSVRVLSELVSHIESSMTHGVAEGGGKGSWADYPYFGSEKFWFIETNTIKGSGSAATSGITDGPVVVEDTLSDTIISRIRPAGVMAQKTVGPRGLRCDQVYDNIFYWTIPNMEATSFHGSGRIPSGMTIRFWVETLALPITPLSLIYRRGGLETQAIT